MRILRLSHSSDADLHRVEIVVKTPTMAPRTATARFTFAVPPADQELIRWYFEVYREGPADVATGLRAARAERRLGELGGELFRAVFEASQDTRRLWAAVQPELAEFRVEIVTDVAGATALPWESMSDAGTGQPLALHAAALVRAHPQAARAPGLLQDEIPVRVLLVISRPGVIDVPFRSVAHYLARLQDSNSGSLRLEVLRPPTFAQLTHTLRTAKDRGKPYQVMHFDGHGIWGDAGDGHWLQTVIPSAKSGREYLWLVSPGRPGAHGYLLFENSQLAGNVQLVDGPTLGNLLADTGVPLLVLNACRTALADTPPVPAVLADPHAEVRAYGSLAQEVMDTGVAGVLAMRYNVYVATAARFVADLYAGLVQGQSFGAAVSVARQYLASGPPSGTGVKVPDWMVPVAYEATPLHLTRKLVSGDRVGGRAGQQVEPASGTGSGAALPAGSDLGFYGRDETLLALDRAFDTQPVVLLHGEAGIGKTATAAEFARWYLLTSGVQGPVVYTSLSWHATVAELAAQLTTALAKDPATPSPVAHGDLAGEQRLLVVRQIMRQVPLLWIWDDLGQVPGHPGPLPDRTPAEGQELLSFLRSARDTKAKLLLLSRHNRQAWLGDLPTRLHLPPLPLVERNLLVRAVAAKHQVQLAGLGLTSAALRSMGGNPKTIIDLTERALYAGCAASTELEKFITTTAVAAQRKD
ncbi:MAG: CHAT domain-containing protein [Streptosporangiaceae bacterium]